MYCVCIVNQHNETLDLVLLGGAGWVYYWEEQCGKSRAWNRLRSRIAIFSLFLRPACRLAGVGSESQAILCSRYVYQ